MLDQQMMKNFHLRTLRNIGMLLMLLWFPSYIILKNEQSELIFLQHETLDIHAIFGLLLNPTKFSLFSL